MPATRGSGELTGLLQAAGMWVSQQRPLASYSLR